MPRRVRTPSGRILAAVVAATALLAFAPAGASAVFTQCPPVGRDAGCQFLVTISNGAPSVQEDVTQGPYEGADDSLIGVQNSSSKSISALPLSSTSSLFGFESVGSGSDGICNPGAVPVAPGCQPAPGSAPGTTCGVQDGTCSYPPPAGEPANYTEPGALATYPAWPGGRRQNGYEGPTTWFSKIAAGATSGLVNFSPPLAAGAATFFSLEAPPSLQQLKVGTPVTGKPGFGQVVTLPSNKKCVSRRKFRIHVRQPRGIKIQTALVFVNGKRVRVFKAKFFRKLRHTASVNLKGLPRGTFIVRIVVLTTKGDTLKGKRTYHTCRKKRKSKKPPKL